MRSERLFAACGALCVGAHVEAEVDAAEDRLRVTPLSLAPVVQDLPLVDPDLGADVRAVPTVGEARRCPERSPLAEPADPDRDTRLQRLRIVRRVLKREVRAGKIRAATLGIQQQA